MTGDNDAQHVPTGPYLDVLAVILARGGSKGIPGKNLKPVGGVPLLARSIQACLDAQTVSDVIVSTDDEQIRLEAEKSGASVVGRPAQLAGDRVSSEDALLDTIEAWRRKSGRRYRAVALVQATSPFTTGRDIDKTMEPILEGGADSTLTVVDDYGYFWFPEETDGWSMRYQLRGRRQDRGPWKRESGNLYGMRMSTFQKTGNLFCGVVQAVTIPHQNALEIDEPIELYLADCLSRYHEKEERSQHDGE